MMIGREKQSWYASFYVALTFILITVLSGCGGGGGGGGGGSPPPTYTLSGTVTSSGAALSGVTVTLSGGRNTTTDASGNYSFSGLANGSYTVTPTKTGLVFSPASSVVNVSGANVTATNFTATVAATTYSISGTVSGGASNGVTITLGGANSGSVQSGTGGAYSISGLAAGSYTLTPSLAGYTFNPTNRSVVLSNADSSGNNFVATAVPVAHTISGTVSGAIQAGVTITVTGTATPTPVTTDTSGNYSVPGLFDGNYTVTPSLAGYTFNPSSTAVTLAGADATGKNFTAIPNVAPTYTLSGTVSGPWIQGVAMTLSGAGSGSTTTNSSGNYSFSGLLAGTYTVTPVLAGYTYSPAAPSVVVSANTTRNFTATPAVASSSVSGTITYAGSHTGPTFIRVHDSGCTSNCTNFAEIYLPDAGGAYTAVPFTIRGLRPSGASGTPASYVLKAFINTLGAGDRNNASNPQGNSATFTTVAGTNNSGLSITVTDKTPPVPATPTWLSVSPGDTAALIQYVPSVDSSGKEAALSYKVYWGTDINATNGSPVTFSAQGTNQTTYLMQGLGNGVKYFKISASNGAGESLASSIVGPINIGATTGGNTVSGTVTFPGSATGPMLVGVYNLATQQFYFTGISTPASPQSYSVSGVPNGSYLNIASIDMNNNGKTDAGDMANLEGNAISPITVSGNTTGNLTLSSSSAAARVSIDHVFDGGTHNYSLKLGSFNGTKRVVASTVVSGTSVPVPFDLGPQSNNILSIPLGTTSPTVGDAYQYQVTYSDGTTENLTASVVSIPGYFAQNLTVTTNGSGGSSPAIPLFNWTTPASPPTYYTYSVGLSGNAAYWDYPSNTSLPSSTTSALYNVDGNASPASLGSGTYTWKVQVFEPSGNSATRQAIYTVP